MELTEKSRSILEAIAKGHTHEQILIQDLAWTYHDIFHAAAEALELIKTAEDQKSYDLDTIRQEHPKAYEKWTDEEDARLVTLFKQGDTILTIARLLQRQSGAIRSRLVKLGKVK